MWGVVSPRRNELRRGLWFGWWVQGLLTFVIERETSAQSPDGDVKSYVEGSEELEDEGEDEVEEGEKESGSDEDDDDGDEESCEGTLVDLRDNRPFILPEDWAVNKFLPMISDKVLKELYSRYQIPDHIPIRLPRENERCYSGRNINM